MASALSRRLGWPLIDKDDIKDVLDGEIPSPDGPAYDIMLRVAHRQMLQGLSIICDSPLLKQTYDNARSLAIDADAGLVVIECHCSDTALWRSRIEARQGAGLALHHITTWEALRANVEGRPGADYAISEPHLIVDTALALPDLVARLLDWLEQLGIERPSARA